MAWYRIPAALALSAAAVASAPVYGAESLEPAVGDVAHPLSDRIEGPVAPTGAAKGAGVDARFSGAWWFGPERNGEGLLVEVLSGDTAAVFWFTTDPDGEQAWILGNGSIDGDTIAIEDAVRPQGSTFGADFDPAAIDDVPWGSLELTFSSCTEGRLRFEGPEAFGSGERQISRLTAVEGLGCDGGSSKAVNAGISGGWFDPSHEGEGFIVQVLDSDPSRAAVFWFTVDTDGSQVWIEALADIEGNRLVVPLEETGTPRGTPFGADFDPGAIERPAWGEYEIVFSEDQSDSVSGALSYDATGGQSRFGSGGQDLTGFFPLAGVPGDALTGEPPPEVFELFVGSLAGVDPQSPEDGPIDFDAQANDFSAADRLFAFAVSTVRGEVDGRPVEEVAQVIYPRQDGSLARVDPTRGADGTPGDPVRVSSTTAVSSTCSFRVGADRRDALNTRLAFAVPTGGDQTCPGSGNSGDWREVALGDGADTAPAQFSGRPFAAVQDAAGGHAGWLVVDGNALTFRAPGGEVTDLGVSASQRVAQRGQLVDAGISFVNVDGTLHLFDVNERSLSATDFVFESDAARPFSVEVGSEYVYYIVAEPVPEEVTVRFKLVRVDAQGNSQELRDLGFGVASRPPQLVKIHDGRIAYLVVDATTNPQVTSLVSLPLDGDESGRLVLAQSSVGLREPELGVQQLDDTRFIFIDRLTTAGLNTAAVTVAIDDPSAIRTWANSAWIGTARAVDSRMALVRGFAGAGNWAGADIAAVDADRPVEPDPIVLGQVPDNVVRLVFSNGFGSTRIGFGVRSDAPPGNALGNADAFFADFARAGSLRRVTDTAEDPEFLIVGF